MANKIQNAKARGRKAQNEVVMTLRNKYSLDSGEEGCYDGNICSRTMGTNGVDIVLSPYAQSIIPFDIEVKFVEKLNIWEALNQSETNTKEGRIPLLVFRRNRSKTYACLEFDKLLELINNGK